MVTGKHYQQNLDAILRIEMALNPKSTTMSENAFITQKYVKILSPDSFILILVS